MKFEDNDLDTHPIPTEPTLTTPTATKTEEDLWVSLHYEILYAKYIYYHGRGFGFEAMSYEAYDQMEDTYRKLSARFGVQPTAADMVGWEPNALIEALAMKKYDEARYERIKHTLFEFAMEDSNNHVEESEEVKRQRVLDRVSRVKHKMEAV